MAETARHRALTVAASLALVLVGVLAAPVAVVAHGNSCSTGNSNYVVIVFENGSQGGANDDICWINTHSYDDEFSVNESGVDDIGENANFHDIVSSMSVKNFGSDGLCVWYYQDAFRSVLKETQWVGAGQGDIHYNAVYNDNYDSLALARISQASCFN